MERDCESGLECIVRVSVNFGKSIALMNLGTPTAFSEAKLEAPYAT